MKQQVVVEIRGGTLVGLYASDPEMEAHVVDWDHIAEHPGDVRTATRPAPLVAMPQDTAEIVGGTMNRSAAHANG